MHWPAVWSRVSELGVPTTSGQTSVASVEAPWLLETEMARDRAFAELVIAVQLGQAAGVMRPERSAKNIARVLTSLVDGFLFQTVFERVDGPQSALSDDIELHVRMVMEGLRVPAIRKQR
jgi:hypothetical protein